MSNGFSPRRPGLLRVRHNSLLQFLSWGFTRKCDELVVTHAERRQMYMLPGTNPVKKRIPRKTDWWLLLSNHREKWARRTQAYRRTPQPYKPLWCSQYKKVAFRRKIGATPATSCCLEKIALLHLESSSQNPPPLARRPGSCLESPRRHIMVLCYAVRVGYGCRQSGWWGAGRNNLSTIFQETTFNSVIRHAAVSYIYLA